MEKSAAIGAALMRARNAKAISRRTLAERLGVSVQFIQAVEKGDKPLPKRFYPQLPPALRDALVDAQIEELETLR